MHIELVKYPDFRLFQVSKPVGVFDSELDDWIAHATEFIKKIDEEYSRKYGISVAGMAGPQLGLNKRLFYAMGEWCINPEIFWRSGNKKLRFEGCFSLERGKEYPVMRDDAISIRYQDVNGVWHEKKRVKGIEGQVYQHEYDHLNGVLLIK